MSEKEEITVVFETDCRVAELPAQQKVLLSDQEGCLWVWDGDKIKKVVVE